MNHINTSIWKASTKDGLDFKNAIEPAAELLKQNQVIGFPTETVYGLGANAFSDAAIQRVFAAKGRPSDNPLIVHVSSFKQFESLVGTVPPIVVKLTKKFWPGPLSVILPNIAPISTVCSAGLKTVAIRMPSHPVALALIEQCGLPIAAPSANISGKPSPTTAEHVLTDLQGRIAGVLDGGPTGVGLESTVIDCTSCGADSDRKQIVVLRPGGVTIEQLKEEVGEEVDVVLGSSMVGKDEKPMAPGMKYTHYAPKAPLYLVEGKPSFLQEFVNKSRAEGKKVGVLCAEENAELFEADHVVTCGARADISSVARSLYDALRQFDTWEDLDIVYGETFPTSGIGQAVMNRLNKAAGGVVLKQH